MIYILESDIDQIQFAFKKEEDLDVILMKFNGLTMIEDWKPLEIVFENTVINSNPLILDFHSLGLRPVFSKNAIETMKDILSHRGEILPLRSDFGEYFVYNVLNLRPDALDVQNSKIKYFKSSGRMMRILKHKFNLGNIASEYLFKLSQFPKGDVFVSELFRLRVEEAHLTGFKFKSLTDS